MSKSLALGVILALLPASLCLGAVPITVSFATGHLLSSGVRVIYVQFAQPIPSDLDSQVGNPANYSVMENVADPDGTITPAVKRSVAVTRAHYFTDPTNGLMNHGVVVLELAGPGYGRGKVKVQRMASGADIIEEDEVEWVVEKPYDLSGTTTSWDLSFPNGTLVADFSLSYTTNWTFNPDGTGTKRQWFNLEGSVPITTPLDVQAVPGANVDASRIVADFVQFSYSDRSYYSTGNYSAWGITVRTSGRLNGLEAVANYQPLTLLLADNRIFFGAELEAGYRDGMSEWINLTQKAPFRGNLVARLGTVIEWAPQLGPINRDLGSGLRFFVRGRGWADYARDDSGQDGWRLRGFVDSELFYDISKDLRVFFRYELGALPPDLTRNVSTVMLGIGKAF